MPPIHVFYVEATTFPATSLPTVGTQAPVFYTTAPFPVSKPETFAPATAVEVMASPWSHLELQIAASVLMAIGLWVIDLGVSYAINEVGAYLYRFELEDRSTVVTRILSKVMMLFPSWVATRERIQTAESSFLQARKSMLSTELQAQTTEIPDPDKTSFKPAVTSTERKVNILTCLSLILNLKILKNAPETYIALIVPQK